MVAKVIFYDIINTRFVMNLAMFIRFQFPDYQVHTYSIEELKG